MLQKLVAHCPLCPVLAAAVGRYKTEFKVVQTWGNPFGCVLIVLISAVTFYSSTDLFLQNFPSSFLHFGFASYAYIVYMIILVQILH